MSVTLPTTHPTTVDTARRLPVGTPTDTVSVSERLMAEFEGRLGLAEVSRVVRECWQDLRRSGTEPQTTVLERCAREHLTGLCAR